MDPDLSYSHFPPLPFCRSLFPFFSTLSLLLVGPSDFQRVVYTIALPLSGRAFIVKSFGVKLTAGGHRSLNLYYRNWMFLKSPKEFCESNCRKENEDERGRARTGREIPRRYFRRKCFWCYLPKDQSTRAWVAILELTQTSDSPCIDPRWRSFCIRFRVSQNKRLHNGILCYSLFFDISVNTRERGI